jgi:predicted transcriptional regulator of viral defense system
MKYQEFKNVINKPYFTGLDILLKKLNIYSSQLSLWQKKGYIGRLKKGVYFFADEKEKMIAEEVSFLICQPSYLSMEFMLSYYGLIPEMVYAKTAITTKTTRKFSNDFGNFAYHHILPKLFFGYVPMETAAGKYLIAEPEKAILDYFYFNLGKLNDCKDIEELRINCDELRRLVDRKKMNVYLKEFNIKKLTNNINILFEIC